MPYKQSWGVSRRSAVVGSPLMYDDPSKAVSTEDDMPAEIDTSPDRDVDIIKQNNNKAEEEVTIESIDNKIASIKEKGFVKTEEELKSEAEEQKYQDNKSWWTKGLDAIQDTASAGGLIPAVGAVADVPNAIGSWARTATNAIGDTIKGITSGGNFDYRRTKEHFSNALLNTTAILPVVGQAAGSVRLAPKINKTFETLKTSAKIKKGMNAIDKGSDLVGAFGGLGGTDNLLASVSGNRNSNDPVRDAPNPQDETVAATTQDTTSMYNYKQIHAPKKKLV